MENGVPVISAAETFVFSVRCSPQELIRRLEAMILATNA